MHYEKLHTAAWGEAVSLSPYFTLSKIEGSLLAEELPGPFDLIYYDTFGPATQPELWVQKGLEHVVSHLRANGVFETYCYKGDVCRILVGFGLKVEKRPDPPGKRGMLRAIKSPS